MLKGDKISRTSLIWEYQALQSAPQQWSLVPHVLPLSGIANYNNNRLHDKSVKVALQTLKLLLSPRY